MKIYGPSISEGSSITNLTAPQGTSFPGSANAGELFFRTDLLQLYVHDGSSWNAVVAGSYQALDATLTALASLTTAADQVIYSTGVDTFSVTPLTSFARTLIDDTDAATMRTTLGLSSGGAGDIWVKKAGDIMTGGLGLKVLTPLFTLDGTAGIYFAGDTDTGFQQIPSLPNTISAFAGNIESLRIGTTQVATDLQMQANGGFLTIGTVRSQGGANVSSEMFINHIDITATGMGPSTNAYISFITDSTYTTGGLKISRDGVGPNVSSTILSMGTGNLVLNAVGGEVVAVANGAERLRISSSGILVNDTTTGSYKGTGTINAAGLYINGTAVVAGGNQSISLTGDITGSGTTSIATTLANAGTPISTGFVKITTDTKGRVTSSTPVVTSDITSLVDATYVNISGDSMSSAANLTFSGGGQVLGLPTIAVGATAATSKAYVDALVTSSVSWRNPVIDPDLVDVISANHATPESTFGLAVGANIAFLCTGTFTASLGTGTTVAAVSGNIINLTITSTGNGNYTLIETPLTTGHRFIVGAEHGSAGGIAASALGALGSPAIRKGDLIQFTGTGNGSTTASWSFPEGRGGLSGGTEIAQGITVLSSDPQSVHYGHTYLYNASGDAWVEVSGPGSIGAGTHLTYSGNTLNVDFTDTNVYMPNRLGLGTVSNGTTKLFIKDESNDAWRIEEYSAVDGVNLRHYRARGTIASPSAVQTNDRLSCLNAAGYGTSAFSAPNAGFNAFAAENFTNTACGTYLTLSTTAIGANTGGGGTERVRVTDVGNVVLTSTTASSSPTTGALVVGGGAGFAKDININSVTVGLGGSAIASNTASGFQALLSNTIGINNTASGYQVLTSNTTGNSNTASGLNALYSNTTGSGNTASGLSALRNNTTGSDNTASGYQALYSNTTGSSNVVSGLNALYSNTTGINNTASGQSALTSNTTGNYNTASGLNALYSSTTGINNTASGASALYSNTTGNYNTASGYQAGYNGGVALQTLSTCTFIGYQANSSVDGISNATALGNGAQVTASNEIALGDASVTAIFAGGDNVATLGKSAKGYKGLYLGYTNTATVGAVTINKASGRVNIAAAGTAVVVTNSLVTAASHVMVVASTNDATARVTSVVPAAGSFTINTAACTAQTSFDFVVFNAD